MFADYLMVQKSVADFVRRLNGQGIGAILARGASGSFAVTVLGTAMSFVTNLVLARILGASEYGAYIYALTVVNLLALLAKFGMDSSVLRFVASYNAKGEWDLLRGILFRSTQWVVMGSIVIAGVAAVVVFFLRDTLGQSQSLTFFIAMLLLPLLAISAIRCSALNAFRRVVLASLPDSLIRPLVIIILVGAFYLIGQKPLTAYEAMSINLIALFVAVCFGTVWLVRTLPAQISRHALSYDERQWIKVALPLFFITGVHMLLSQTDIIMLGAMIGAEQAGIYAAASRVAGIVGLGIAAVNTISAPLISELYSTGDQQRLQRMITIGARGMLVMTFITAMVLIIFGNSILGLFGDEFVAGEDALFILLAGQCFNVLSGSVGTIMTMTGHQNQAALIFGTAAIINILLNAALIPMYGMVGAAAATALTTVLWNLAMLAYVWNKLKINPTALSRIY